VGYNAVADNTGLSSFVWQLLASKSAKSHEILLKFVLTLQGHTRSSILVPIESAYTTFYITFIVSVLLYLYLSVSLCLSVSILSVLPLWRINFIINSNLLPFPRLTHFARR